MQVMGTIAGGWSWQCNASVYWRYVHCFECLCSYCFHAVPAYRVYWL